MRVVLWLGGKPGLSRWSKQRVFPNRQLLVVGRASIGIHPSASPHLTQTRSVQAEAAHNRLPASSHQLSSGTRPAHLVFMSRAGVHA